MAKFKVLERNGSAGALDPEANVLLSTLQQGGDVPLESLSPEDARIVSTELFDTLSGEKKEMHSVKNVSIKLTGRDINIRIYSPEGRGPFPALVYFHGGGWVVGNLDTHDQTCRELAYKTPCVVVAVEYRLSPEHIFPAAVDDCYESFIWVFENTKTLNVKAEWLAVGGDSAGGNLATVVSMLARDRNGPKICWQMLVYPVTNLSSFATKSYEERGHGNFLTDPLMEWFRNHYIPDEEARYTSLASPLLSDNLTDLPPAWILTAEYDPLCEEGEAYARALHSAGVSTICVRYNGMIHPFWLFAGAMKATHDAQHEAATAFSSLIGVAISNR